MYIYSQALMHLCLFLTGAAIPAFPPGNSSNIRMYQGGASEEDQAPVCSFSVAGEWESLRTNSVGSI